jgi:phage-related protein
MDEYQSEAGARPVAAFSDGLSARAREKVLAAILLLKRHGNELGMPHSRALGAGLHELRIAHPAGPFRVFYTFRPGRRIVLLHAFTKRTQETPERELAIARRRMQAVT